MSDTPLVTVVIPARNEATDIGACIEAVAAQDYPASRMEVLVVDGMSEDDTAAIARRSLQGCAFGASEVLSSPDGATPSNLNVGLAHATGDVLCRVDARSRIEEHHIRTCVEVLQARGDVAVVGGAQVALARDDSSRQIGIARALNNPYLMGGALYRRATASGPTDTVYMGCFRVGQLRDAGGWDTRMPTNQDFDLNRRMAAVGLVWFDDRLRSGYLPRTSLRLLWRQYVRFGRWKVRYWRTSGDRPLPRQWALLAGPPTLLLTVVAVLMLVEGSAWPVLLAALLGVGVVDAVGSPGRAPLPARLWSVAASMVIAGGWWAGAALEALAGDRRGPVGRRHDG